MLDWKDFVNDVEVILDSPEKVDHLCYYEIEIHPHSVGTLLVGAYKYIKESNQDKELINFFEGHGVIICTIIQAIEYGLSASEGDTLESYVAPCYFKDQEVLRLAFEKGRSIQRSIQEEL